MPRQLLLVPLLVVLVVLTMAAGSFAQSFYPVTGRIVSVSYVACGDEAVYGGVQYLCRDWVMAEYVADDQVLRRASVEAQTYGGDRPAANDIVTCIIDGNTYGLLRVEGWYHPVDINQGYGYARPYYSPLIIERPYYGRPYGGHYGPRYRVHRGPAWRPRHFPPPPRYKQPHDRVIYPRQYGSPDPAPRRSPNSPGIRPRPDLSPGSPPVRPPDQYQPRQREQRPVPAERPRDSGDRSGRKQGDRSRPGR